MDRTWARHAVPLQRARKSMVSTGRKTASGIRLCNGSVEAGLPNITGFQYRKRYSPVQQRFWILVLRRNRVSIPQAVFACVTSEGVFLVRHEFVSRPQAVFACVTINHGSIRLIQCFNTASGIRLCNLRSLVTASLRSAFQYRKRYSPV